MTELPGLDEVREELYAGDPADFVAVRDGRAREARGRKERALADAIKALRRPTVSAWYLNVGARADLTSLRELLRLGGEMRDAQADLDFKGVLALGAQRADLERRVLADLTAHLAVLGVAAAPGALEEVRGALRVAVMGPEAAAVQAGCLDRVPQPDGLAGFGAIERPDAVAPQVAPPAGGDGGSGSVPDPVEAADADRADQRARAAEAAAAQARARVEAERALDEARRLVADAEVDVERRRSEEARLTDELAAATVRLKDAEASRSAAQASVRHLEGALAAWDAGRALLAPESMEEVT